MTEKQFIDEISAVQEPLRRFLCVLCGGDAFTADDIAQDACMKAWLAIGKFRGESKFSTYIMRIAYNCWCSHSSKPQDSSIDTDKNVARYGISPDSADEHFKYQSLYKAISELNPNEKAAILLFYMEDKEIKEIAVIMDMPEGTVKSLLSRGRTKLKIKLQDNERF